VNESRVTTRHVFEDDRGSLVAVEFSETPFPVRRAFVVTGPPGGADRGDHLVPCGQQVVLISGRACFEVTSADGSTTEEFVLDRPGQQAILHSKEHVRYRLEDAGSRVLVLAEHPYTGSAS
jgi:hypothetical protein